MKSFAFYYIFFEILRPFWEVADSRSLKHLVKEHLHLMLITARVAMKYYLARHFFLKSYGYKLSVRA